MSKYRGYYSATGEYVVDKIKENFSQDEELMKYTSGSSYDIDTHNLANIIMDTKESVKKKFIIYEENELLRQEERKKELGKIKILEEKKVYNIPYVKNPNKISIYSDINFTGASATLGDDSFVYKKPWKIYNNMPYNSLMLESVGVKGTDIKSIIIPSNMWVKIYHKDNYTGNNVVLKKSGNINMRGEHIASLIGGYNNPRILDDDVKAGNNTDRIYDGMIIDTKILLKSPDGMTTLGYYEDGNLCRRVNGYTNWCSSRTKTLSNPDGHKLGYGNNKPKMALLNNGNLQIFDSSNNTIIWQTNTGGNNGPYYLVVQNDTNICIYDKDNNFVWNSGINDDNIVEKIIYNVEYKNAPGNKSIVVGTKNKNGEITPLTNIVDATTNSGSFLLEKGKYKYSVLKFNNESNDTTACVFEYKGVSNKFNKKFDIGYAPRWFWKKEENKNPGKLYTSAGDAWNQNQDKLANMEGEIELLEDALVLLYPANNYYEGGTNSQMTLEKI